MKTQHNSTKYPKFFISGQYSIVTGIHLFLLAYIQSKLALPATKKVKWLLKWLLQYRHKVAKQLYFQKAKP